MDEDPLCQMWHLMRSFALQGATRDDEAFEEVRRSLELDANFWLGYSRLGMLCVRRGDHLQARQCAEKAMASAPWSPYSSSLMAVVLMNEGQLQPAESLLAAMRADSYGGPVGLMCYHAMRGEMDIAAEWAVKVGEQRFPASLFTVIRPFEPILRQSTSWPRLMKTVNLA